MTDFKAQRAHFRRLHEAGCFVIPNPWDVGTARYLQHLGFQAVATTSSGFAFSRGLPDSSAAVPRELVLAHFAEIAASVDIPVNADFQSGYGADTNELAESVRLCVGTGISGFSIEDATGDSKKPLFELDEAVDRIAAARHAIDESGVDVLLTARAECFLVGHPDPLNEAIRRLQAYSEAGADVLFAPGPGDRKIIQELVDAVSPKPLNAIMSAYSGLTVDDLAELGVRRISVGSSLSRVAWTGFINAAKLIAEQGSFEGFEGLTPYTELNEFFTKENS